MESQPFKGYNSLKSVLNSRLLAFRIPTSIANQLTKQIVDWVKYHGEEWTVDRLKKLRILFLSRISGETKIFPYIATNRIGNPRGAFNWLFKNGLGSKRAIARTLKALTCYKFFIRKCMQPSLKQGKKFFDSLSRDAPTGDPSIQSFLKKNLKDYLGDGEDVFKNLPIIKTIRSVQPTDLWYSDSFIPGHMTYSEPRDITWLSWCSSPSKRTRKLDHSTLLRSTSLYEKDLSFEEFVQPYAKFCTRSPNGSKYMRILEKRLPGIDSQRLLLTYSVRSVNAGSAIALAKKLLQANKASPKVDTGSVAGSVSFIQEPGYKCRAIANPFRVYQWLTCRLGTTLFGALRRTPNDYTFNQEGGVRRVQRALQKSQKVFCVDLSDATNNFPMVTSSEAVKEGLKDPDIKLELSLFEEVSRMSWEIHGSKARRVKWTVGQPLGLFPSFGHFAVGHHALLQACSFIAGYTSDFPYAVLGDDVAIWDETVHSLYREFLDNVDVPVSEAKCFSSTNMAEFAGRTITPNQVYVGHRYGLINDLNVVSLAREIGAGLEKLCNNDFQRYVVRTLKYLPEPIGLGFNPRGLPISERVRDLLAFHTECERPPLQRKSDLSAEQQLHRNPRLWGKFVEGDWMVPTIQRSSFSPRPLYSLLGDLYKIGLPVGNTLNHWYEHHVVPSHYGMGGPIDINIVMDFYALPFDVGIFQRNPLFAVTSMVNRLNRLNVAIKPR